MSRRPYLLTDSPMHADRPSCVRQISCTIARMMRQMRPLEQRQNVGLPTIDDRSQTHSNDRRSRTDGQTDTDTCQWRPTYEQWVVSVLQTVFCAIRPTPARLRSQRLHPVLGQLEMFQRLHYTDFTVTSPPRPGGGANIAMSVSVCLYVCSLAWLEHHLAKLHQMLKGRCYGNQLSFGAS